MSLRFILGRAGSGKTRACLEAVGKALKESPQGPALIILVPEQASFQMEQALLNFTGLPGVQRAQVLSFRRLAYRVFQEAGGAARPPIGDLGKLMVIRALVQRRSGELRLFGRVADRSGFIQEVHRSITEFHAYGHTPADLRIRLEALEREGLGDSALGCKLHDLAIILEDLDGYLRGRFTDPDQYLTILTDRISGSRLVRGATVWADGFAGFTPQEFAVLGAIMRIAEAVNVALCLDPEEAGAVGPTHTRVPITRAPVTLAPVTRAPADDFTALFHPTLETMDKLEGLAREAGVPIDPPMVLPVGTIPVVGGASGVSDVPGGIPPRFWEAPDLAHLEREFFSRPGLAFQDPVNSIRLIQAPNRRVEVESAAREILRLCREEGHRFRDIAVTVPDLETYHSLLASVFEERGIPYFIDRRAPVQHHPVVELLRSALEAITSGFSYEPVFRYLKTDLVPVSRAEVDRLENYVLEHGIRGSRWITGEPWTYLRRFSLEEEEAPGERQASLLDEINDIRSRAISGLRNLFGKITSSRESGGHTGGESCGHSGGQSRGQRQGAAESGTAPYSAGYSGGPTVREISRALFELLEELGVAQRLEEWRQESERAAGDPSRARGSADLSQANEYAQIYDGVLDLLDQMVDSLGDVTTTPGHYLEVLEAGLEGLTLGLIPPSLDQVVVGSPDRSRHPNLRGTMILGATDRAFPPSHNEDVIWSDREREELQRSGFETGPTSRVKLFHEQFLTYQALTQASRYLWLSYPMADEEGHGLSPSMVWQRIRELFPAILVQTVDRSSDSAGLSHIDSLRELASQVVRNLRVTLSTGREPVWLDLYQWIVTDPELREKARPIMAALSHENTVDPLPAEIVGEVFGDRLVTSVTRLESFSACAFQHFAAHVLRLQERSTYQVEAPHLGQLYHAALSRFVQEIRRQGLEPTTLATEEAWNLIDRALDEYAPRLQGEILLSTGRYRYILRLLRRTLHSAVEILQEHVRRGSFRPVATEVAFGRGDGALPAMDFALGDGRSVRLSGRIDRVEAASGEDGRVYLRVIDYKSGPRKLQLDKFFYGLSLQLALYLLVAVRNETVLRGSPAEGAGRGSGAEGAGLLYFPVFDPILRLKAPGTPEEIRKERRRKYRMDGLVAGDISVVRLMDRDIAGASDLVPVGVNQDGSFRAKSRVAGRGQMQALFRHLEGRVSHLATAILAGQAAIEPCRVQEQAACQWCRYRKVCHFDPLIEGNRYRSLKRLSETEVWRAIGEEPGQADGPGDWSDRRGGEGRDR